MMSTTVCVYIFGCGLEGRENVAHHFKEIQGQFHINDFLCVRAIAKPQVHVHAYVYHTVNPLIHTTHDHSFITVILALLVFLPVRSSKGKYSTA